MEAVKTSDSIPNNIDAAQAPNITNPRIQKERIQLIRSRPTYIHDIIVQNDNEKQWDILLLPPRPPYNDGIFRLRLTFPSDYPFKPPHLRFVTPIYHPNIDEKGQMCLSILQYDNWKPGTNIGSIIQSLIFLLNDPEPERPLRQQIAEQIYKDKRTFINEAIEHTKKHAEKKTINSEVETNTTNKSSCTQ